MCTYCNLRVSTDREDPIPRNLYSSALRGRVNLLKIPSCRECNLAKSQTDNVLRDFLCGDIDSSRHEDLEEICQGPMLRAVGTNRVRLIDRFYEGTLVAAYGRGMSSFEEGWAIPINHEPLFESIRWLTRGLHWAAFGDAMEPENVEVKLVSRNDRHDTIVRAATIGCHDRFTQGSPLTTGWIVGETGCVYWFHSFFDSVLFIATTQNPTGTVVAELAMPR